MRIADRSRRGLLISVLLTVGGFAPAPAAIPGAGPAEPPPSSTNASLPLARFTLRSEQVWQLNLPKGEQFDASGLLLTPKGDLLTVNDRGATLYRIDFRAGTNSANLLPVPDAFTAAQLASFTRQKTDRYDCEGIAQDERGRLYLCDEADRWVLRFDPKRKSVERLDIDWSPVKKYFHATDRNASFEGIAVGGGKIYVANERQLCRIIVVDLKSLKVGDDFQVWPSVSKARDVHYSDLSWFDGALYVLLRDSRYVLKVDPASHRVLAEYSYGAMEREREENYNSLYPTGTMEGLAVEKDFFWLVTDNNGRGRARYPNDARPTLFKCRRPEVAKEGAGGSKAEDGK